MLAALKSRQEALEETLRQRLEELKKLCLREAVSGLWVSWLLLRDSVGVWPGPRDTGGVGYMVLWVCGLGLVALWTWAVDCMVLWICGMSLMDLRACAVGHMVQQACVMGLLAL